MVQSKPFTWRPAGRQALFPPYQASPWWRQEALNRWPKLRAAFRRPGRQSNRRGNANHERGGRRQHRDPAQVVKEFRQAHGL